MQEVQKRLDFFYGGGEPEEPSELQAVRVHYAEALEGKIVVGTQYGEELNTDIIKYSLYPLASSNARRLMQLADIERFAVDDCIILTNSRNFQGWNPNEIKTTVLSTRLLIPDDLEKLKQEKLPVIEKDYFNSSHYRLVSFTPSFSDLDQLEVTLAPLGFHEYYSLTPLLRRAIVNGARWLERLYSSKIRKHGADLQFDRSRNQPHSCTCEHPVHCSHSGSAYRSHAAFFIGRFLPEPLVGLF